MQASLRRLGMALACLLVASSSLPQSYTFRLFAGNGGNSGTIDGTGPAARFAEPSGIAVDPSGNVYVSETVNQVIRKITPAGVATTFAGLAGNVGSADGRRYAARFKYPNGLAADSAGNIYVADMSNDVIRKITPSGLVTTLAGTAGAWGAADGTGASARFYGPSAVAVDLTGTVFVADRGNGTIRQITPAGVVSTIAGTAGISGFADGPASTAKFSFVTGIAVDSMSGAVYVTDFNNRVVRKIFAGSVSTLAGTPGVAGSSDGLGSAAMFGSLWGITVDGDRNIFVVDAARIRKITPDGLVSTVVNPFGIGGTDDGPPDTARLNGPMGIAADPSGALYFTENTGNTVRKVAAGSYVVSTFAGHALLAGTADGTGTAALFNSPTDIVSDSSGNLYVAEGTRIRKITADGVVSTLAGSGSSGNVDGSGTNARFACVRGIAIDSSSSNLYAADPCFQTIRKITLQGDVTTFAGVPASAGSQDGPVASATFNNPSDVAIDAQGNVYVVEYVNQTVRKISAGVVSTFAGSAGQPCGSTDATGTAARFCSPMYIAIDASGNIVVGDFGNLTLRKITTAGVVTTLAGTAGAFGSADGTGAAARFLEPRGIGADGAGNVYVADGENRTIRRITSSGVVTTVGGTAGLLGTTDGTDAVARFERPQGVAVDPSGRIYVADYHGIRRGTTALTDRAVIDVPSAAAQLVRQLGTSPSTATTLSWSLIRRPADSTAEMSNSTIANPTFTPDAPDLYVFALTADDGTSSSITEVTLTTTCPAITIYPQSLRDVSRGSTYSEMFFGLGSVLPYRFSSVSGTRPSGLTLAPSGLLSGQVSTLASLLTYHFTIRATDRFDCTADHTCSLTVRDLAPPKFLTATAMTTTSVRLTWARHATAVQYGIIRRDPASLGGYAIVATIPQPFSGDPTYIDSGLQQDTAYLYAVGAMDGNHATSGSSIPDLATTVMFKTATLTPGATVIRAGDLGELRRAVNAVRSLAALPSSAFTDPTLSTSIMIKRQHVMDLRAGLDAARAALALSPLAYTDPTITPGVTTVKAAHVNDLRNGVK